VSSGEVGARDRKLLLLAVFACIGLAGYATAVVPVFGPEFKRRLAIGDEALGVLLSAVTLGGAFSIPLAGILGDRIGHRKVLRFSLLGLCGACLFLALLRHILFLALALGAIGLFSVAIFPSGASITLHLFPGKERRLFSLNLVVVAAAGIIWPIAAEALLSLSRGKPEWVFQAVLRLPFALLALLFFLFQIFLRGSRFPDFRADQAQHAVTRRRANHWNVPALLFVLVLVTLHASADTALYNWMPTLLDGLWQASERAGRLLWPPGLALSAYSAAYLGSRLILSALPERMGRRVFLVLPGIIGGSAMMMGLLSGRFAWMFLLYVGAGFVISFEYPQAMALGGQILRGRWGTLVGMTGMLNALAAGGVTAAVGLAAKKIPLRFALLIPALEFIAFGVLSVIWIVRQKRTSLRHPANKANFAR